jgi:hypothetical protein
MAAIFYSDRVRLLLIVGTLLVSASHPSGMSVPIKHIRSGIARVHYEHPPGVVLDLRTPSGHLDRIPLSYDQTAQQRRGALWEAELVYESPKQFMIFTDTFASNANVQGACGASDGERFLHVVSLQSPVHETLSVVLDSCWLNVTATKTTPIYTPTSRTLTVKVLGDSENKEIRTVYTLDERGSVTSSRNQ